MVSLLYSTSSLSVINSTSLDLLSEAQQQSQFSGISMWIWLVVALIVVIIGVVWTLYEEGQLGRKRKEAQSPTEPTEPVEPEVSEPVEPEVSEPAEPEVPVEPEISEPIEPEAPEPAELADKTEEAAKITPEPSPKARPDNLKRVKGIGPKVEKLLKDNGITTFAQLAKTEVNRLQALLDEAEYTLPDPTTWPEQARQFIR